MLRAIFEDVELNERWIFSIVTSGGSCSLLRKLAPIHLCCCSLGLLLPGLKTYSEDNTQHLPCTCLPAQAGKRSSGSRRRRLHTTRVPLSTHLCVHPRFAQGLPDFPPELSSFPFHCFLLLLILRLIRRPRPSASVDAFEYSGLG